MLFNHGMKITIKAHHLGEDLDGTFSIRIEIRRKYKNLWLPGWRVDPRFVDFFLFQLISLKLKFQWKKTVT